MQQSAMFCFHACHLKKVLKTNQIMGKDGSSRYGSKFCKLVAKSKEEVQTIIDKEINIWPKSFKNI